MLKVALIIITIYMVSSMMALTMSLALFCKAFTAFLLETLAWVENV